jgi:hypothetical protein
MVSGATTGSYFLLSSASNPGALYRSLAQPQSNITPSYNDIGTPVQTIMQSSSFPKTGHMAEKQVIESTVELSSVGAQVTYTITAMTPEGNATGTAAVTTKNIGGIWGANNWGDGTKWASTVNTPSVYTVPWGAPVVFKKFVLNVQATAVNSLSIGTFYARYQDCGYTLMS